MKACVVDVRFACVLLHCSGQPEMPFCRPKTLKIDRRESVDRNEFNPFSIHEYTSRHCHHCHTRILLLSTCIAHITGMPVPLYCWRVFRSKCRIIEIIKMYRQIIFLNIVTKPKVLREENSFNSIIFCWN